ncbi:MAG: efflux RND transporter periplasmic adaptor subunit [Alphaproteobacteria bacterium]|jgi:membrane fusion protein (multidrug efflux system)|nr:efflux RND transporter periplasmic adaptor subunit [Alphaproteobacteria bacterium]
MDFTKLNAPKPPFNFSGERIAFLIGGALLGALAIWFGLKMATPIVKKVCQSILENPDKANRADKVISIEAIVVKPGTISRRITTVGKLRADQFVTLKAEMQGRIKEIRFKEGTMVKKGDLLIQFEDEELKAELERAEADVEYRVVKFGRLETLQTKGLGRGTEYDQERGGLNMAKAQVDVAKAKLAKSTIYAPFDGKIGLIDVSVGATVDPQKDLVTIVDFDPMKIEFKIPEKFIHDIGVGQTAEVKLDSMPNQTFQATVEAIDSRVDPQTHSIAVRASIPNEDGKLQTGLFGSVGVIIGVKNDALLVPESALGREGDIEYVWVVTNGKTGRKRVLTGTKENGQAEITAGLRPDEIVVTSGQLKLGEGTAVKISNMGEGDVEVLDEGEGEAKEASKSETPKAETPKEEPKAEAAKAETPKVDAPKVETPKEEPKVDAPKVEPKVDAPKVETPKVETPKEESKVEAPKEESKVEAPKEETPKVETPKEEPKVDAPMIETPAEEVKPEAPKVEISPTETPNVEAPTPDASKPEEPKADTLKVESPTTEEPKVDENPSVQKAEAPTKIEAEKSFFRKSRDYIVNKLKGS